jgi:hypothetical protein
MPAGWVAAAASAVSAGESIAGNMSAQGATNQNNQTQTNVANAQNQMLGQASQVANQPFVAYTGQLTAPMSANEQQGNTMASNVANNQVAQGDVAQGTALTADVANNGFSQSTIQNYMNPYTQDVTNNAITAANRSYAQNLSTLNENAAQSNAFGGSGNAIEAGELAGQNQLNVANVTANNDSAAYTAAVGAWNQDNQTKLAAANAYNAAGQDITQMDSTQISDLMKTGGVAQGIAQTNLSNQYAQFMRQQNWSASQLQPLIQSVGTAKGNAAVSPAVQSNVGNQLLGLGSTVAGLFGGSSGSASGAYASGNAANLSSTEGSALSSTDPGLSADSAVNIGGGSAADLDLGAADF